MRIAYKQIKRRRKTIGRWTFFVVDTIEAQFSGEKGKLVSLT